MIILSDTAPVRFSDGYLVDIKHADTLFMWLMPTFGKAHANISITF
jgi:hypothetical protein